MHVPPSAPSPGPLESLREPSPKRYGTAVCLSAVLGFAGVQHFYLGRVGEGLLDVGLSLGWVACFVTGHFLLGALFLAADVVHAFATTILLLTGHFRDGNGRIVCYPGQRLGPALSNPDMRRTT